MEENSKLPRILKLANPLKDSTVATFFLVVNPGFEAQAQKEAEALLGAERLDVVTGGIQFDSTWGAVRLGQPQLKFASRILVRVDQFGARDFQKLFRKVSNLPWEEWLKPKTGLSVRAASQASRLRIKAGIEESVGEAFRKSFKAPPPRPTQEVMCLVRVEDDICTISLDLSGDLLHKRGSHTDVGVAPLRETWAASIVDRVLEIAGEDENVLANFQAGWEWVEPMAGTAVFLREALSMATSTAGTRAGAAKSDVAKESTKADVAERTFAMETCFKFERDEKFVAELAKKKSSKPKTEFAPQKIMAKLKKAIIADRDPAQLERAKKALAGLAKGLDVEFNVANMSARSPKTGKLPGAASPPKVSAPKSSAKTPVPARLVIVNPPWGQRLKGADATDSPEAQAKLMASIETIWQPSVVALVLPRIAGAAPRVPKGWEELAPLEFRAGGIPVKARFFMVPQRSVRKP